MHIPDFSFVLLAQQDAAPSPITFATFITIFLGMLVTILPNIRSVLIRLLESAAAAVEAWLKERELNRQAIEVLLSEIRAGREREAALQAAVITSNATAAQAVKALADFVPEFARFNDRLGKILAILAPEHLQTQIAEILKPEEKAPDSPAS